MYRYLAFSIMVLACVPAEAASFDCARAETALEVAICGNPLLFEADDKMASAFKAARKRLSTPASAQVLDNQRAWLDYAERACTDDARPKTSGAFDSEGQDCLISLFNLRKDALDKIGSVGGLTFYPVESYRVVPDPDPESWNKVATTEISYSLLDGGSKEAQDFNAFAKSLADNLLNAEIDPEMDGTANYATTVVPYSVSDALITLQTNDWFYGHGAAHGNYAITYAHYLRDEGRALTAEDVFVGRAWAAEVRPMVIAALIKLAEDEGGDADWLWLDNPEDVDAVIVDPARWGIEAEGIGFQFQPYEVSAYAFGAPDAFVSWKDLSPWLRLGAAELLAGN